VARAQEGGRDGGSRREDYGLSRWRQGEAIPTDGGEMGKGSREKITRVSRGASPCASSSSCGSRRERAELGFLLVRMELCGHAVGSLARPRVTNLDRVCTVRGLQPVCTEFFPKMVEAVSDHKASKKPFRVWIFKKSACQNTKRPQRGEHHRRKNNVTPLYEVR
jgi:hypothetical protein